jgi:16S rRNA (guanine966-N2)-methyltransferase
MRIIAGTHRGRPILPPPSDATRPITDRVKQSLFDILSPHIEGAHIYDIFAGTGSMGLECLSRGAADATFFEADRGALINLRKNIAALKLENQSKVVPGDLFKWFASQSPITNHQSPVTIAFLDPPYRYLREQPGELQALALNLSKHSNPEAIVVFRHDAADSLELPPFRPADVRNYGSMTIEFLRVDQTFSTTTAVP